MYIVKKTISYEGGIYKTSEFFTVEDLKTFKSNINHFNDTTNSDQRHSFEVLGSITFNHETSEEDKNIIREAILI